MEKQMNGGIVVKATSAFQIAPYYKESSAIPTGKPRAEKSARSL